MKRPLPLLLSPILSVLVLLQSWLSLLAFAILHYHWRYSFCVILSSIDLPFSAFASMMALSAFFFFFLFLSVEVLWISVLVFFHQAFLFFLFLVESLKVATSMSIWLKMAVYMAWMLISKTLLMKGGICASFDIWDMCFFHSIDLYWGACWYGDIKKEFILQKVGSCVRTTKPLNCCTLLQSCSCCHKTCIFSVLAMKLCFSFILMYRCVFFWVLESCSQLSLYFL